MLPGFANDALAVSEVHYRLAVPTAVYRNSVIFPGVGVSGVCNARSPLEVVYKTVLLCPLYFLCFCGFAFLPIFRTNAGIIATFVEAKHLKMLNLAIREFQQACAILWWLGAEKAVPFHRGRRMPSACSRLAAPPQAKGKLPPDVNPVEPVRQFNKLHLLLHVFTRKLITFLFSNCFYFRDGKFFLLCYRGKKSNEKAHDFCFFWNLCIVMLNSCKQFALQCSINKGCHQLKGKLSKVWGAFRAISVVWGKIGQNSEVIIQGTVGSWTSPVVSKIPNFETPS